MKRAALVLMMTLALMLLCSCGGQEIESSLFVVSMAVDPAPDGTMRVTVKALSGTQETGGSPEGASEASPQRGGEAAAGETAEAGYIVLSATAPSCLRALSLLAATTPRTLNLSQLQEIVISQTLAMTDATLSILREIHAMYRANSAAIVVVTPDDAGDFIRRQRALLGVRLSQYLRVLFEHDMQMDVIPPYAQLSEVIAAMESSTRDAAAVYAAGNDFSSELVLREAQELDRLPGHLPRTSPAQNEYLGSALFSGARMTGTLTGSETETLCLLMGESGKKSAVIDGAQYRINLPTRIRRSIAQDGTLTVHIKMNMTRTAGESSLSAAQLAAQLETTCVSLIQKLQAAGCDAAGFGLLAVRRHTTVSQWETSGWAEAYPGAPLRVTADIRLL